MWLKNPDDLGMEIIFLITERERTFRSSNIRTDERGWFYKMNIIKREKKGIFVGDASVPCSVATSMNY